MEHRNINLKKALLKVLFWLVILVSLCLLLIPIYYMISSSFKTKVQMMDMKQFFVFKPTLKNYVKIFTAYDLFTPLLNSLIVSLGATGLACLLGLPAAYAIARHRMHTMSAIILCVRIVPAVTFLVPWYIILGRFSLIGTKTALILSNLLVLLPLIIWIVSPYFGSIPKELEDAALIDGCSEAKAFTRIMIPLAVPGIVTAAILAFIHAWNNFMFAYVLGGSGTKTLPTMLKLFIGYTGIDMSALMAASVVVTMPVVIISIVLQKYVVSGLTAGAVKG
ncbi:carbohydrate ABC transporter permease [Pseudoflavonifractor sp. MSJ-30]|uniref:carbohydrate ABC transporter permease n=1 Tax=Pseudoflavonifractor sp. MSJ-30 TaxID=2841525 RepID=UPI001C0FEEC5|nr:carbohydrate ABC transporter permease [Pseudoflavonifractor sp. MSJ-30]MBU5451723.1 carbohydrate ABC transporter permease [Pseudoflavonifractor sp. MSJ-30]